jgi:hypothetical protein
VSDPFAQPEAFDQPRKRRRYEHYPEGRGETIV